MHHRSISERIADNLNVFILAIVAVIMIFPFFYIFAVSFSTLSDFLQNEFFLWPKRWVTDAYEYILSSENFIRSLGISTFVTIVGTLINLFFTSTMAYALSRPIAGQRFFLFFVLFTVLFNAGMIPTYLIVKETGLIDSVWSLIIPIAISPFYLIVMRQFFKNVPDDIHEAALIDGANELQIFWKIMIPLSKPALAAFGLFYAVMHWNNYFTGILYINDPAKWPVQVVLRQIVVVNEPNAALGTASELLMDNPPPPETIQMAAILLATLPILIVYPFLQKHFAKGVLLGSVKG
ncbi:carbohydrate ABC transporter permease [Pseudalkalibacillus salsuginis]|uniref:carbohydrate ABC transporter permease n=1 Tax=Pseudalkalibacillus salsuginis TaxID=2910972 RepID=UPI001F474038|nr:carbohydrate ABC transporter permease [Pseudalkalibacillus salsuginis]MCF6409984.1 carbohydrate ABC transporter permease [Pseudalkalibacillus salsuginis]